MGGERELNRWTMDAGETSDEIHGLYFITPSQYMELSTIICFWGDSGLH